ncbi:hypothetical protein GCM10010172_04500 [Paractinoplanes ferrugineus]|uniref:Uncharacterized protein n=1 Tax=Paractinoplanes ferrugineus TaxID=113564 RepID=A0A919JAQ3_9ACTN|nr:hypothetical protein [Actinoplanes ferrugineus]GIE16835.1 hypothetical protein Afe05nite_86750 [Actinoplanes ferrugineus]
MSVSDTNTRVFLPHETTVEDLRGLHPLSPVVRALLERARAQQPLRVAGGAQHRMPDELLPGQVAAPTTAPFPMLAELPGERTTRLDPAAALSVAPMPLPSRAHGHALAAANDPESQRLPWHARLLAGALHALPRLGRGSR